MVLVGRSRRCLVTSTWNIRRHQSFLTRTNNPTAADIWRILKYSISASNKSHLKPEQAKIVNEMTKLIAYVRSLLVHEGRALYHNLALRLPRYPDLPAAIT